MTSKSIDKVLIANRGEIACRIIRTARQLGIRTVAVYSDADAAALHVEMADEAVAIGPPPPQQSYLNIERIVAAAKRTAADAVHPGYGFLSENAAFAQDCTEAGLIFIGPSAAAIDAMGSKSAAKAIMEKAAVPVVPGYHGDNQSEKHLQKEADRIGYPLLIKATAGGGGKGMRLVEKSADFAAALAAAKRESKAAFNDDKVLLERYLTAPRHIEIQVFRDSAGNGVYLFERDCSVQRRHQKVLEEAPAPGMTEPRRQAMGKAALTAAAAIDYQGAGTVEFIVEDDEFYFMEMNTRLQVEHPVTEMITGIDLVEWQFRIASGEPLPLQQDDLHIRGHALEARLYAEDPAKDFLPCTGTLLHLRFPPDAMHGPTQDIKRHLYNRSPLEGEQAKQGRSPQLSGGGMPYQVRVDTGVRESDAVSVYYDPMITKLITWGTDRHTCLRGMAQALSDTRIVGLNNNLDFIKRMVVHPAFAKGGVDTGFIPRYSTDLLPQETAPPAEVFILAALHTLLSRRDAADPSPWSLSNNWQLNLPATESLSFTTATGETEVTVEQTRTGYRISRPAALEAQARLKGETTIAAELDGTKHNAEVIKTGNLLTVFHAGNRYELTPFSHEQSTEAEDTEGRLTAPMPGRIVAVLVKPGQSVTKGQPLLILEAMKMEHTLTAPKDATVKAILYKENQMPQEGTELITLV